MEAKRNLLQNAAPIRPWIFPVPKNHRQITGVIVNGYQRDFTVKADGTIVLDPVLARDDKIEITWSSPA